MLVRFHYLCYNAYGIAVVCGNNNSTMIYETAVGKILCLYFHILKRNACKKIQNSGFFKIAILRRHKKHEVLKKQAFTIYLFAANLYGHIPDHHFFDSLLPKLYG